MKKLAILFTCCLTIVFSIHISASDFFSINPRSVKGKYKSLVIKSYCDNDSTDTLVKWERCYFDDYDSITCDTKGNILSSFKFDSNWQMDSAFFEYDNLSNRICDKSYNSKGKLLNYTRHFYKYDNKNRIIEEIDSSIVDGLTHVMVIKGQTLYDENGNKTEDYLVDEKGNITSREVYKYNNENKVVEQSELMNPNRVWNRQVYKYDSLGYTNLWEWYDQNGQVTSRIKRRCDKDNNLLELTEFQMKDGKMKFQYRTTLKYDEHNNQTEVNYFNEKGDLLSHQTFCYKYDDHGNWIECTGCSQKYPSKKIVRKIVYF